VFKCKKGGQSDAKFGLTQLKIIFRIEKIMFIVGLLKSTVSLFSTS